jgi:RNA polymerase sigma-70 factor (ECF subfamily)
LEPVDALLMKRWQAGDATAAAQACERYGSTLYAVAYAVLGDGALAEDAVQETFARAAANPRSVIGVERLGPWLAGITRHAAIDMARKRRREEPLGERETAARHTPYGEATRHELRDHLQQAVDRLPADQREIFALKYIAGLRYADIARVVGTTPEAVSQKLWRIRQKLQEELKEFRP